MFVSKEQTATNQWFVYSLLNAQNTVILKTLKQNLSGMYSVRAAKTLSI